MCACDYNPVLNPSAPLCRTISESPSEWYSRFIAPKVDHHGLLGSLNLFEVSSDTARIFKEASGDISQFVQCGYECVSHLLSSRINVHSGIIRECPIKEHCRAFFEANNIRSIPPGDVWRVYIYTDGGFNNALEFDHTTWGLCIVVVDCYDNMYIWGSAGGIVPFDEGHPAFFGEVLPSSSFVAEVYAQIVAKVVLLQWFHMFALCPATPIVLVYDRTSANLVASSSVQSKSQPVLTNFANVLGTLCVSLLNIQYSRVHSHKFHPFND